MPRTRCGWALRLRCDEDDNELNREAIRLITVEFPGYRSSLGYQGKERDDCLWNVQLYALAVLKVFLGEEEVE
jgi:hypothetical protein